MGSAEELSPEASEAPSKQTFRFDADGMRGLLAELDEALASQPDSGKTRLVVPERLQKPRMLYFASERLRAAWRRRWRHRRRASKRRHS